MKKPLMTKVSMRHLNEIVRERNQYSRDAMEAWQDFINLKGRMDMDLSKVTKRNNFLVEELESWKQQVSIPQNLESAGPSDNVNSSSNSRLLPNSLLKRLRTLRSRSSPTSVRIAISRPSLINRKTTRRASLYVFQVRRDSATMLLKRLSCSKRLQKSLSASESATSKSLLLCNILTKPSRVNGKSLRESSCTFEV